MTPTIFRHACAGLIATALSALVAAAQSERNFYDDFQGTALNPAFRVLNPDRQRMALTRGEYLLLVTHPETKNIIQYTAALPEDYAVTVRIAQPPENPQQSAQILVGDTTNNVRVGMYIDEWQHLFFGTAKTLDGENAGALDQKDDSLRGEPVYLRFVKVGVEYEGHVSADGVKWTSLGKQVLIDPGAPVSLQVYSWGDGAESPVNLDSFEITEILN